MKKNEECEIVRDLLPSYLEKLTNEKTNEFIEKHIAECEECKKVLEKMNEKVALDIVQNKKEADYLKKAKRRQMLKNSITSIILFITVSAFIFICVFVTTCEYKVRTEDGKVDIAETMKIWLQIYDEADPIEKPKVSHILMTDTFEDAYSEEPDNMKKVTFLFTFDLNKNICLSTKICQEGYSEKEMKTSYESLKKVEIEGPVPILTDVQMVDGKLIYSLNEWVRKTKEEVLKDIQTNFSQCTVLEF